MERDRLETHHQPALTGPLGAPRPGGPLPSPPVAPRRPGPRAWVPSPLLTHAVALTLALAVLLLPLAPGRAASPDPAPNSLPAQLLALCRKPEFASATWGMAVHRAESHQPLFELNAHTLLKPASCAKLATAALALDQGDPHRRQRTQLLATGPVSPNGTLHGDLILRGHGDFSFSSRFDTAPDLNPLQPLATALARAGIRRIQGALVANFSHFPSPRYGTGWTWDDLRFAYGAPVGALNLDDNLLRIHLHPGRSEGDPVRGEPPADVPDLELHLDQVLTGQPGTPPAVETDWDPHSAILRVKGRLPAGGAPWTASVPVRDPHRFFLQRLHGWLPSQGIQVDGGIRVEHAPTADARNKPRHQHQQQHQQQPPPPLEVESRPLAELVQVMLKASQNQYAQLLLLQCGAAEPEAEPGEDLEQRGLRALRRFLQRCGIPPTETLLDDGSGLSRSSLVTPAALVQLLQVMDRHPQAEHFRRSLPLAGVDGTLKNRLRGTAAEGNLRAKTGTLRHVHTLSGYVTNAAGHRLVFALFLNAYQPPPGGPSAREAIDAAADLLARSRE